MIYSVAKNLKAVPRAAKEIQVVVRSKSTDTDQYWTSWIWDEAKPLWLVICNYPSNNSPWYLDVTKMLIIDHVMEADGGGVIVGNLFSRPISKPTDVNLARVASPEALQELADIAKIAKYIVNGTGSLTAKSKVAQSQMKALIGKLTKAKLNDRVCTLVNGKNYRGVHPLSLQGLRWFYKVDGKVSDRLA